MRNNVVVAHRRAKVAEGLGVLLYAYVGQLAIGMLVTGIVALRKLRTPTASVSGWRTKSLWAALGLFFLSILADAWFLFESNKSLELVHRAAIISVSSLCLALVLALVGMGPGRLIIPIMSVLFALPWLPFILM